MASSVNITAYGFRCLKYGREAADGMERTRPDATANPAESLSWQSHKCVCHVGVARAVYSTVALF